MFHQIVQRESKLIYVWNKNSPIPAKIPDEVGFKVGNPYSYIILQLHYYHGLLEPDFTAVEITFSDKQ